MTTFNDIPLEIIYKILKNNNDLISPLTKAHKPTAELIYGNNGKYFELLIKTSSRYSSGQRSRYGLFGEGNIVLTGIRDGIWRFHHDDILCMEANYNLGIVDGEERIYHDGIIRKRINWYFGVKHGFECGYNEVGDLTYKYHYNNGILDGEMLKYNDEGDLIYKLNYRSDVLEGKIFTYNNDFVSSFTYVDNLLHGPAEFSFGDYILSGEFHKGQYNGIWTAKYEDEKLQAFFHEGRVTRVTESALPLKHSIFPAEGFYKGSPTYENPLFKLTDRVVLDNKNIQEESIKLGDNTSLYYVDYLDSEKRIDVIENDFTSLGIYVKKDGTEVKYNNGARTILIELSINNRIRLINIKDVLILTLDEDSQVLDINAPNFVITHDEHFTIYTHENDIELRFSTYNENLNLYSFCLENVMTHHYAIRGNLHISYPGVHCIICFNSVSFKIKDGKTKSRIFFDKDYTIQHYEVTRKHKCLSKCNYVNGIISDFTKCDTTYEYEKGILFSKICKDKIFYIDGIYPKLVE